MDSDLESELMCLASAAAVAILRKRQRKISRNKRAVWCSAWLLNRRIHGAYNNLLMELQTDNEATLKNFLRMDLASFNEILELVNPLISKESTHLRDTISAGERLAITLRFLATGDAYQSLAYLYRVSKPSICTIIPETCDAIYEALKDMYLTVPSDAAGWKRIADEFDKQWQFPHCIGALDGKHIVINAPYNSGSVYYNYKHTYSIVLMALVDANYEFIYVDVGCNGRISDGGVFGVCSLNEALVNGHFNLPEPEPLSNDTPYIPYMIVADEAFPLRTYIQKPYPYRTMMLDQRVFNYRLSRAVENAFGILSSRFRVFSKPIQLKPENVRKLVMASCALHNYLRRHATASAVYIPPGSIDVEDPPTHDAVPGEWRNGHPAAALTRLPHQYCNRYAAEAKAIRDSLCIYFNSAVGEVPWQWNRI